MKYLLPILALWLLGCQRNECVTLREGMDQGTRTIRQNEKDWAEKLVAYPKGAIDPRTGKVSDGKNQANLIPPLTPAQYEQNLRVHTDYENLVNNARQHAP